MFGPSSRCSNAPALETGARFCGANSDRPPPHATYSVCLVLFLVACSSRRTQRRCAGAALRFTCLILSVVKSNSSRAERPIRSATHIRCAQQWKFRPSSSKNVEHRAKSSSSADLDHHWSVGGRVWWGRFFGQHSQMKLQQHAQSAGIFPRASFGAQGCLPHLSPSIPSPLSKAHLRWCHAGYDLGLRLMQSALRWSSSW